MVNNVQFPGLGIELQLDRVAFTLGNMQIYWYGILIAVGMMLAFIFAFSKAKSFGINDDRFIDVVFGGTIAGILGARLYYVAFAPFKYDSIWQMLDIRDGGLAIYGGIIVGFISACLLCKWRKVPILPVFDLVAMGFLIGQGIGRWGNFVNQEAFGTNTTLPWGMISENTTGYLENMQGTLSELGVIVDPLMPVHPTFLYESLWCLLGFALLYLYINKRKFNGEIFLIYIMWYGVERAFVEGLRTDSLNTVNDIRVSQAVALISALTAFIVWVWARKKYAGKPLMISYDFLVYPKRKNSPTVNITWKLGDKMPTQKEIVQIYKWANLPVGVWHIKEDTSKNKAQSALKNDEAVQVVKIEETAKEEKAEIKAEAVQSSNVSDDAEKELEAEKESVVGTSVESAAEITVEVTSNTDKNTKKASTKKASTKKAASKSTAAKETKATANVASQENEVVAKPKSSNKKTTSKTKSTSAKTTVESKEKSSAKKAETKATPKKAAAKTTKQTKKKTVEKTDIQNADENTTKGTDENKEN